MNKKKWLFSTIITVLTVVSLAACGSSSSNKSSSTSTDKLAQIKKSGKLTVGTSPDFPPSEFYILNDKGEKEIVGSDISLAKAIAKEIGVKLDIKATDFNGVLANIQTGSVDIGISGFVGTDERKKIMDFSDGYEQEVSDGYQGILTTKEVAQKYTTLADLKKAKLKVGSQSGSIQYELATAITSAANIKQYGTMDAAVLALNSGDIDAVTVSTTSVEPLLTSFPNLTLLSKEEFNLDPKNKYATNVIGIPKDDANKSLIKLINKVIKENKDNGNLKKWKDEATEQAKKAINE
ncbi:transporter substrate-binding domain-containing protein [Enterococcus camelliae]|uniref:Transporter substrate-binding domain-containing protein n=1 Tax=Enterococcus camelliae TaxID=453959 RepID=A0ABW5TJB1_9ENTE